MSGSSNRNTQSGLKPLSGQFPVYHLLSGSDDEILADSYVEGTNTNENIPLKSKIKGFGHPSDLLNSHEQQLIEEPYDDVYQTRNKASADNRSGLESFSDFRRSDNDDGADDVTRGEPECRAVTVNPYTNITPRQDSRPDVIDPLSSRLRRSIHSQALAKNNKDSAPRQSLSPSHSITAPHSKLGEDVPTSSPGEKQTSTAGGFPSTVSPDLTRVNIRLDRGLAAPDCVDLGPARETPQDTGNGLHGWIHLPGRVNTQVNGTPGTLLTHTGDRSSNSSDVLNNNNSTLVTKTDPAANPRSDAGITYKEDNNNDPIHFSALCDRISPQSKSCTKVAHDGGGDSRGENSVLIQGDNSDCNNPLLQQDLYVPETANRDYFNSRQTSNSFGRRVRPDLQSPTMGDLYVIENGAKPVSAGLTDDNVDFVVGVQNGYALSRRKGDNKEDVDDEEDDGSGQCGWGRFQFEFCRHFRNARWFLVVLTICGACQGMAVNGFVNTVISTVERRFEISSTESGLIASCYDIMFVVLVIPISYFGGMGHKPKYLGIGIFVLGIGSFVFALPHFIADNYHVENADETVCKSQSNLTSSCSADSSTSLSNYKYFFYLGQLLHGAGATPLYTLGVTYLDENVPQRSSSFYNGIFYTGAIIGPAIGYMVGAKFLDVYTDVTVDPTSLGLDPSNPKWIGAWWIGFLISGLMGVLLALPLMAYPASLPGSKKYALERGQETQASKNVDQTGQHCGLKDIILSLKYLVTNIPFMFINIAAAAEGILVAGFSTFMPKFIEYEFGLSAGTAALYVGLAVVPAGGGATFGGGFIVKCFNLKVRGILRLCTVMSFVVCVLTVALLLECNTTPFAGVTLPYGQTDVGAATFLGKNLENTCNQNCSCVEEDYFPVCGRDKVMYFSPCYAGCTEVIHHGSIKRYANCSCVNYNLTTSDYTDGNTYLAEFGKCEFSCKWLTLFMVCFGFMIVFVFITSMPSLAATLRCVPDHQRSFGLGIQWIVARCLGSIPGPILFGKMFDFACLLWQKRCSGDGSCFFYDTHKLSLYLLSLALAFAIATAISFLLALIFYKVKKEDDELMLDVSKQSEPSTIHGSCKDSPDSLPKVAVSKNGNIHSDKDYTGTSL
ncbi:hypothetical protein BsWGS_24235 [Bradybaena similaris]